MKDTNAGLRSRPGYRLGHAARGSVRHEPASGSPRRPGPARERLETARFALAFAAYRVELAGEGEISHFHEIQVLYVTLLRDLSGQIRAFLELPVTCDSVNEFVITHFAFQSHRLICHRTNLIWSVDYFAVGPVLGYLLINLGSGKKIATLISVSSGYFFAANAVKNW